MALIWLYLGKPGASAAAHGLSLQGLGAFAEKGAAHLLLLSFLAPGAITMVLVSLLTKPEDAERTRRFAKLIRTPVGREHELEEAGIDIVYMGEREGHPWELNHGRAVNTIGFLVATVFCLVILAILYGLARVGA
jgi:hypothetical protein